MTARFFGQYLLEKGLINPDALLRAVTFQESRNSRLGDHAVSSRMLTREQVDLLHSEQRRTDRMFGELAVERGWLTRHQLDELVALQKKEHVYIGEALVHVGACTRDVLERELVHFHEEQRAEGPVKLTLPPLIPQGPQVADLAEMTSKLLRRVANLVNKMSPPRTAMSSVGPSFIEGAIRFKGALQGRYALRIPKNVAGNLAKAMVGSEVKADRDLADAVCEFANVVAGNCVGKMAADGLNAEISPPEFFLNPPQRSVVAPTALYHLHTADGDVQVLFESSSLAT